MIDRLNETEVYRVGMCIETAGLDFYTKMAERADDPATKRVFKRLARDEKQHLAFFESLEIGTAGGLGSRPPEADEDLSEYVCALVDGGIFKDVEKLIKLAKGSSYNPEKALSFALQVEKDAVLYYTEAQAATKKRSTREALKRLTEEEKRHVVQITNRLDALRKKKTKTAGGRK